MQSQMIGLQSSLDRILATLQNAPQTPTYANGGARADLSHHSGSSAAGVSPDGNVYHPGLPSRSPTSQGRKLSPLLRFASQPHKSGTYGIEPNAPSDDESEDAFSRAMVDAPIEIQPGLTNPTVGASAAPAVSPA